VLAPAVFASVPELTSDGVPPLAIS
jgi:hypothetical protein